MRESEAREKRSKSKISSKLTSKSPKSLVSSSSTNMFPTLGSVFKQYVNWYLESEGGEERGERREGRGGRGEEGGERREGRGGRGEEGGKRGGER